MNRRNPAAVARSLGALGAAVAVPICYFGTLLVAGFFHPGYSHLRQLPSELGAVGAPHPAILNGGLILTAAAFLVAGPALARATRTLGSPPGWSGALALALIAGGVYFVLMALLPLPDPRHHALFPLLLPVQLGPFCLERALARAPGAVRFRRFLLANGIVLIVLLAVAVGFGQLVTPANQGGFVRLSALAGFGWIGAAGWILSRPTVDDVRFR
jgi:hypothetical protein